MGEKERERRQEIWGYLWEKIRGKFYFIIFSIVHIL